MGNINYDSYYKFSVSLGIILVILPITAIIFLFTDSFNLQVSKADLATYTNTAQDVIRLKQSIPLLIHKWYVWLIACLLVIAGTVLIVYGLFCWHKLQKLDDICKKLEAEKANDAIKKNTVEMTDEQIIKKCFDDIPDGQIDQENALSKEETLAMMKNFLMKQKFLNKLKKENPSHLLKPNIMIGKWEYDIVAFSQNFYEKDYIYSVKYLRNEISLTDIQINQKHMKELKSNFSESFNRTPYMVLAIIVPDDIHEHTLSIVNEAKKWNNYSIEVIRESELELPEI